MLPEERIHTRRSAWQRLRRNKGAMFGLIIICLSVLIAFFCYFIATDRSPNANRMVVEIGGKKPGYTQLFLKIPTGKENETTSFFEQLLNGKREEYQYIPITAYARKGDSLFIEKYIDEGISEPQAFFISQPQPHLLSSKNQLTIEKIHYLLGTDKYGRDILSRLLVGGRVSLAVGLITVIISLSIGILLGAIAGYFRGWVDDVVMWFINVIWSIPTLLLVFAITLALGKGFWQVFIAVGLTMWVSVARIVRGQVLGV